MQDDDHRDVSGPTRCVLATPARTVARSATVQPGWPQATALTVVAMLALSGCASLNEPRPEVRSDVQKAVAERDCRAAYVLLEGGGASFDDGIAAAQICLQTGDFVRAERLAGQAEAIADHPDVDYAGYLRSLARFGRWSSARGPDIAARIDLGREVYADLLAFSRNYPLSSYTEEVAPRMVRLRADIARLELRRAEQARAAGQHEESLERARYVRDYYEGSDAAREAASLLREWQDES